MPCPLPSCFNHSEFFFWKIAYLYFSHLVVFLRFFFLFFFFFFFVPSSEKKVLFSFCLTSWDCGFCSGGCRIVLLLVPLSALWWSVVVLVVQSCMTLCNPMDCSPPGSSVHGILQARILEWAAIPFCRGLSQPRDLTQVFCIAGGFFTI